MTTKPLNADGVRDIRKRFGSESSLTIALDYGISLVHAWRIAHRKCWAWVNDDTPGHFICPDWDKVDKEHNRLRRVRKAWKRAQVEPIPDEVRAAVSRLQTGDRLPDLVVTEIRRMADQEFPISIIARRLNLSYFTVYGAARRKTYRKVG